MSKLHGYIDSLMESLGVDCETCGVCESCDNDVEIIQNIVRQAIKEAGSSNG